jgi:hypothetical protein
MTQSQLPSLVHGMVAGAIGTAAMTASERLEMSLSGRPASQVPGQVGAHLLPGSNPRSASDVARLNTPVHWAHGVTMGALRAALDAAGVRGPAATAAHLALVWGGDAALYRTLGIAGAPWNWGADELATDLLHKGVYAAVTGAVYDALSPTRHTVPAAMASPESPHEGGRLDSVQDTAPFRTSDP